MIQGIKTKDIRGFEKACKNINDIIERISKYKPEARLYVADCQINLMSEFLIDETTGTKEQEKIVSSVAINKMDCGSW